MNNLLQNAIILDGSAPIATGTSEQFSSIIDSADCDGVLFTVRLGSPAANNIVRAQQNTLNQSGGMADLLGSAQISGTSNIVVVDVAFPQKRYVRLGIVRGTTTTIDSITAVKYNVAKMPAVQPTGTVGKQLVAAAEGTP
jgi:hypothetical protein